MVNELFMYIYIHTHQKTNLSNFSWLYVIIAAYYSLYCIDLNSMYLFHFFSSIYLRLQNALPASVAGYLVCKGNKNTYYGLTHIVVNRIVALHK